MTKTKAGHTPQAHTPEEIAQALRTFIQSGSVDGRPWNRAAMLKLVPLFATAPDLLEAAKDALEILSSPYLSGDGVSQEPMSQTSRINWANAITRLRAAIAKAEGR